MDLGSVGPSPMGTRDGGFRLQSLVPVLGGLRCRLHRHPDMNMTLGRPTPGYPELRKDRGFTGHQRFGGVLSRDFPLPEELKKTLLCSQEDGRW